MLYLAKKGKIVTSRLDPYTLTLVFTGESYNIYKYEFIRKILMTDSMIVALGDSTINMFRKLSSTSDSRHYSLYEAQNAVNIYPRLIAEGFTFLLLQYASGNLIISSCRVRAPFLKLITPRGSIPTTVTATSVLDR